MCWCPPPADVFLVPVMQVWCFTSVLLYAGLFRITAYLLITALEDFTPTRIIPGAAPNYFQTLFKRASEIQQ